MTVPIADEQYDWQAAHDRLRQAADQVGEAPPAWQPQPGDEIVGVVVDVQPSVYTRHGNVPVVTLQGPNGGRRSVWLIHTVLRRGFIRANVQLGETVLVRYVGVVQPEGGGQPWHDYRVVVDRAAGGARGPDWQQVAKEHEDEAALEGDREAAQQQPDEPVAPPPHAGTPPPPTRPADRDPRCAAGEHDFDESLPPDQRTCRRCGELDIPF